MSSSKSSIQSIDMHNLVTIAQAKSQIERCVDRLLADPQNAHRIPPILLRGAPGVGKSTIIREIAKERGIEFIDIRLSQLERVDIGGLPSVENGMTRWNPPAIFPQDPTSKGILLLDEITAAPADVQVAAYQLVLDRCISNSNYKLPDGWYIVAAGNRACDRAVAKTVSSALANRLMHFEIDTSSTEWIEWAIPHGINPTVTGFLQMSPGNLFRVKDQNLEMGYPTPRSWERVSNIVDFYSNCEDDLRLAVFGLIGPQVGSEFMAYYKVSSSFDNVLTYLTDPKAKIEIPKQADRLHALCSAAAYLLWDVMGVKPSKGKTAQQAREAEIDTRVKGLFRIAMKLTPDFAVLLLKTAMLGSANFTAAEAIAHICKATKEINDYSTKFGMDFTKQYKI